MIYKKLAVYIIACLTFLCASLCSYASNALVGEYLFQKDDDVFSVSHLERYYVERALKAYYSSDYDNALKDFDTALSFNKNNPIPWQYKGVLDYSKGAHDQAIYMLQQSLEAYPESFGSNFYMGRAFEESGNTDKALSYYKEAVHINPHSKDAYLRIFRIYKKNRKPVSIIEYGKSCLNFKHPNEIAAFIYMWVGYAYIYLGDYDNAIDNIAHSKRLYRADTPEYFWVTGLINIIRAQTVYRNRKDKKMLEDIEEVLSVMAKPQKK